MCHAAVPAMQAQGWGRVVAITSIAVRQPIATLILSNTARAGLTGFELFEHLALQPGSEEDLDSGEIVRHPRLRLGHLRQHDPFLPGETVAAFGDYDVDGVTSTAILVEGLRDLGARPDSILAVTFTNKAAEEMRNRVAKLVGPVAEKMWVSTFHSACARVLRREATRLGFTGVVVMEGRLVGAARAAERE